MPFMKGMFAALEKELGNVAEQHGISIPSSDGGKPKRRLSGAPATRWERSVIALDGIVKQVVKVDPDGIDIVLFGGEGEPEWHRNIKNTKNLETEVVAGTIPRGSCKMGAAMDDVLKEAFDEKDMTKRPVAILVVTAGKPCDADDLDASLKGAVQRIAETCEKCPLSVTFCQIGNDAQANAYLKHLDNNITAECSATGETFDLVDTIKEEDIQGAMKEIKGTKSTGTNGAIIGAFAGAALGVGGAYLFNKHQAKKRTEGWGGKWKVSYDGEEISTLEVKDDQQGNLTIEGFPSGEPTTGTYTVGEEFDDEYAISFMDPSGDWEIEGTIEDEHAITWSDGTRWDEIPPDGGHWSTYAAGGVGGAAGGAGIGYLVDKQFFKQASKKDQADYIILMDKSAKMAVVDPM